MVQFSHSFLGETDNNMTPSKDTQNADQIVQHHNSSTDVHENEAREELKVTFILFFTYFIVYRIVEASSFTIDIHI